MGCRNSPLTIKPYPMKIRGEYIYCNSWLLVLSTGEISNNKGYTLIAALRLEEEP